MGLARDGGPEQPSRGEAATIPISRITPPAEFHLLARRTRQGPGYSRCSAISSLVNWE
jgi:hypothetical protein